MRIKSLLILEICNAHYSELYVGLHHKNNFTQSAIE